MTVYLHVRAILAGIFVSHIRALCSQCVAHQWGEKVSAQVTLLRVGLATLRLPLCTYVCTAYGQVRVTLLDRRWGCVSRGELATGGWAHLKRADCHRTARVITEVSLELELGVMGG